MKYFFKILLLLISINSFAQQDTTFNIIRYYNDSSLYHTAVKGLLQYDSCFIVAIRGGGDNSLDAQLVKIDRNGKFIDSIYINQDSIEYPTKNGNCLIKDLDGNIIFGSEKVSLKNNSYGMWDGYLIKLDANLDTIWTRTIHFPDSLVGGCNTPDNMLTAIELTPEGNYILMGYYFHGCDNTQYHMIRPFMCKYDTNGNVLWRKTYPGYYEAYDIATTSDSGFVFNSRIYGDTGIYVCKTDSYGNLEWVTQQTDSFHHYLFSITTVGDEAVSVVPYVFYEDGPYYRVHGVNVAKVNTNTGNLLWSKYYKPTNNVYSPNDEALQVEVDHSGNILIAGCGSACDNDTIICTRAGFLLKLNSNGDSLWSKFYDYGELNPYESQFTDLIITENNGILAGGYWWHSGFCGAGAWLVKTDSMGNAPFAYTIGLEENELIVKNKMIIYPNPTSNNMNLRFAETPNKTLDLTIFNSSGKLVMKKELSAYAMEERIDVSSLASGVYFVKIVSENGEVFSGKVVKE